MILGFAYDLYGRELIEEISKKGDASISDGGASLSASGEASGRRPSASSSPAAGAEGEIPGKKEEGSLASSAAVKGLVDGGRGNKNTLAQIVEEDGTKTTSAVVFDLRIRNILVGVSRMVMILTLGTAGYILWNINALFLVAGIASLAIIGTLWYLCIYRKLVKMTKSAAQEGKRVKQTALMILKSKWVYLAFLFTVTLGASLMIFPEMFLKAWPSEVMVYTLVFFPYAIIMGVAVTFHEIGHGITGYLLSREIRKQGRYRFLKKGPLWGLAFHLGDGNFWKIPKWKYRIIIFAGPLASFMLFAAGANLLRFASVIGSLDSFLPFLLIVASIGVFELVPLSIGSDGYKIKYLALQDCVGKGVSERTVEEINEHLRTKDILVEMVVEKGEENRAIIDKNGRLFVTIRGRKDVKVVKEAIDQLFLSKAVPSATSSPATGREGKPDEKNVRIAARRRSESYALKLYRRYPLLQRYQPQNLKDTIRWLTEHRNELGGNCLNYFIQALVAAGKLPEGVGQKRWELAAAAYDFYLNSKLLQSHKPKDLKDTLKWLTEHRDELGGNSLNYLIQAIAIAGKLPEGENEITWERSAMAYDFYLNSELLRSYRPQNLPDTLKWLNEHRTELGGNSLAYLVLALIVAERLPEGENETAWGYSAAAYDFYLNSELLQSHKPKNLKDTLKWLTEHRDELGGNSLIYLIRAFVIAGRLPEKESAMEWEVSAAAYDFYLNSKLLQSHKPKNLKDTLKWLIKHRDELGGNSLTYLVRVIAIAGKIPEGENEESWRFSAGAYDFYLNSELLQSHNPKNLKDTLRWLIKHREGLGDNCLAYLVKALAVAGKLPKGENDERWERSAAAYDFYLNSELLQSHKPQNLKDTLKWLIKHRDELGGNSLGYLVRALGVADRLPTPPSIPRWEFSAAAYDRAIKGEATICDEIRRIWTQDLGAQRYRTDLARFRAAFNPDLLPNLRTGRHLSNSYRNLILGFAYDLYGRELIEEISKKGDASISDGGASLSASGEASGRRPSASSSPAAGEEEALPRSPGIAREEKGKERLKEGSVEMTQRAVESHVSEYVAFKGKYRSSLEAFVTDIREGFEGMIKEKIVFVMAFVVILGKERRVAREELLQRAAAIMLNENSLSEQGYSLTPEMVMQYRYLRETDRKELDRIRWGILELTGDRFANSQFWIAMSDLAHMVDEELILRFAEEKPRLFEVSVDGAISAIQNNAFSIARNIICQLYYRKVLDDHDFVTEMVEKLTQLGNKPNKPDESLKKEVVDRLTVESRQALAAKSRRRKLGRTKRFDSKDFTPPSDPHRAKPDNGASSAVAETEGEKLTEVPDNRKMAVKEFVTLLELLKKNPKIVWGKENEFSALIKYEDITQDFEVFPTRECLESYPELVILDMSASDDRVPISGLFGVLRINVIKRAGELALWFREVHPSRGYRQIKPKKRRIAQYGPWSSQAIERIIELAYRADFKRFYASTAKDRKEWYQRKLRTKLMRANLRENYLFPFANGWEEVEVELDGRKTKFWQWVSTKTKPESPTTSSPAALFDPHRVYSESTDQENERFAQECVKNRNVSLFSPRDESYVEPLLALIAREQRERFERFMGTLTEREREVLELLYGQGLSVRRAAGVLILSTSRIRALRETALGKRDEFFPYFGNCFIKQLARVNNIPVYEIISRLTRAGLDFDEATKGKGIHFKSILRAAERARLNLNGIFFFCSGETRWQATSLSIGELIEDIRAKIKDKDYVGASTKKPHPNHGHGE
ncbi:MAG: hypothetical protein JSW17_02735 [Candidatus Omnitrophota bacterium]|nr:MAG: hypothetical protein JSW17_02735 [Candidatus Omnitrophota bacterium]